MIVFTRVPPVTKVARLSYIPECGSSLTSDETIGSSTYWTTPAYFSLMALRTDSLTAAASVFCLVWATMSTVEPSTTGTLRATTDNLPSISGSTCVRISAELVSEGMMFSPAARLIRNESVGTSARRPELDIALTVVIKARLRPNASSRVLRIGATALEVFDPSATISGSSSRISSLMPLRSRGISPGVSGLDVRTTLRAPLSRCPWSEERLR